MNKRKLEESITTLRKDRDNLNKEIRNQEQELAGINCPFEIGEWVKV